MQLATSLGLEGLEAEARKAPSFDDFERDYLVQIKHGHYYHITDDPHFTIEATKGPRDMSSIAMSQIPDIGKLMLTSDLSYWLTEYPNRKYVALIDMSQVPREAYYQVSRGFGNEFFVSDPSKARVVKIMTRAVALKEDRAYDDLKPESSEALRVFYNRVKGPAADRPSTVALAPARMWEARRGTVQNMPSTEEFNRLSEALAQAQRGAPERAMLRIQHTQLAQLYGHVAEHTGDLIHRMSQSPEWFKGDYDDVYHKVKRVLSLLNAGRGEDRWSMPFEKDFQGQIRDNLTYMTKHPEFSFSDRYKDYTFDQALAELKRLGHEYAEEHRKLKPLNEAQRTAQEAAIAIGEFQFDDARQALAKLSDVLDKGAEAWSKYATIQSSTVALAPEILKQYPLDEVPKKIDVPPEADIPPVKGSRMVEKNVTVKVAGRWTDLALTTPDKAQAGESVIVQAEVVNTSSDSQEIAVSGTFFGKPFSFDPEFSNLSPGENRYMAKNFEQPSEPDGAGVIIQSFVLNKKTNEWAGDARVGAVVKLREASAKSFKKEETSQTERSKMAAFPTSLTMEQYNRSWKPKGWKIIFIGPTSTWRQDWGVWEAIRDIVQNALDETEAYESGYDDLGFYIKDKGRGVGIASFLLGPPALKSEFARGKFGEGMKIASLALVRAGYPVWVETVGKEVRILFLEQQAGESQVKSLAALWKEGGTSKGTIFHIIGYKGEQYVRNFAINLPREAIIHEGPSLLTKPVQRMNQIIESSWTNGPKIYVRDIFMQESKTRYSYNLWSFELAPDRFGPKNDKDMWYDIGRLWATVTEPKLLKDFFMMVSEPTQIQADESNYLRMDYYEMGMDPVSGQHYADIMRNNSAAWQGAWQAVFGDSAVIRTTDRWDGMVKHLGYTPINIRWSVRGPLLKVIKTDEILIRESQDKLREVIVIPDEKLTARQLAVLRVVRKLADKIVERPYGGVKAAIIPPASDRTRTAGMYSTRTSEIFLSTDQLDAGYTAVGTGIHEIAHHTSEAEDGEEKHNAELSQVGGLAVQIVAQGGIDDLVKDNDFAWS